jgi:hypothetical protein
MNAIASLPRRAKRQGAPALLAEIVACWRSVVRDLFDAPPDSPALIPVRPYRPERHYMRGPGPKWHAKHGAGF